MYLSRQIQPLVSRLLKQFPAVLVTGARQVGKSTLLKHIAKDYAYLTFDDPLLLEQAKQEPRLFFLNHAGNVILDEVQYAHKNCFLY
ncbi:AAA family ATPase [Aggregatibacter actinomycetemcomitans]|nr:AAA family ATPase [Aggregatibacter actinomycetemcomitans]